MSEGTLGSVYTMIEQSSVFILIAFDNRSRCWKSWRGDEAKDQDAVLSGILIRR